MTTSESLDAWLAEGKIDPAEHAALAALARRERFSVFVELNALLYIGVLAVAGGLAWTARVYSQTWGDAAVLAPLTLLLVGALWYCASRGPAFAPERVEAPGLAFDYVLYLACLVFGVELGYIEYRFHLLQDQWDVYLLASAAVYFLLAYRFDNRFVLSLGIATLGGWFGVRLSRVDMFFADGPRASALAYGLLVAGAGTALHRAGLKRHFLDSYLHVAANVVLSALVSGVYSDRPWQWALLLTIAAGLSIAGGVRYRRFAFVVYGVVYAYAALLRGLQYMHGVTDTLTAVLVSAGLVVIGLMVLSRRFDRAE
jgi:hypothetical protein